MNATLHHKEAEVLLAAASAEKLGSKAAQYFLAAAQVHALLALTPEIRVKPIPPDDL